MSGTEILLLFSGTSTGLGLGLAVWGWRTKQTVAIYFGAALLLHGIAQLGFYLVWTYAPFTR